MPLRIVNPIGMVGAMKEEWRDVPGFEALYAVSSEGRVLRKARTVRRGFGDGRLPDRIVPLTPSRGYMVVNLWRENTPHRWLVHRLVALAFLGASELSVDHINGDKADNCLTNLRYCSLRANTLFQHAAGRVRFVTGEENGKSKMTGAVVREARELLKSGLSSRQVAERFGVSKGTIQAMREGRTWAHIT